jgi:hypothetical protein
VAREIYSICDNKGFYTMGNHLNEHKSKRLSKKLLTLDLDEGIRIESSIQGKKAFVNKNASGIFVVQLVIMNKSFGYDNKDVRYFDSAEEVAEFVNLTFQNRYSIVEY